MNPLTTHNSLKIAIQLGCALFFATGMIHPAAAQSNKSFPAVHINYGKDAKNTAKLIKEDSDIINQCAQLERSMIITLTTIQSQSQEGEVSESSRDVHQEILEMFREIVSECRRLKYSCENEISSTKGNINSCDDYIQNYKSRQDPSYYTYDGNIKQINKRKQHVLDLKAAQKKLDAINTVGRAADNIIQAYLDYLSEFVPVSTKPSLYMPKKTSRTRSSQW